MTTENTKTVSQGIATITNDGAAIFAITKCEDGTFGWRSHGKMDIPGKASAYKFRKGFESAQVAIAAALCYLGKHFEVDDSKLAVVAYVAPTRVGLPTRRMVDTEEYAAALKLTKGLKLPNEVKKAIAAPVEPKAEEPKAEKKPSKPKAQKGEAAA